MEDPSPPYETVRALSDLYAFQCSQWEPIRNSQIIGRYKEIPVKRKHVDTKGSQPIRKYQEIPVDIRIQIPKADGPPIWNCQSSEWPLRFSMQSMSTHSNSQIIGRYKEIPVKRKHVDTQRHADTKGRWSPPYETVRALSDLYAFQCSQWVPIRNSQIIGRYKEIPVKRKHVDTKGMQIPKADGPPPLVETARALSDLYAFQCSQWVPIRNSQIIGRYKEIPVQRKHVDTKGMQIPKADGPPLETARALSDLYAFQCCQWVPIRNSQIIGRYKEIPVQRKHVDTKGSQLMIRKYKEIPAYIRLQIPKADSPPPGWNCQSSEWSLHYSMLSMSTHLKQSNNRKISGNTST